MIFQRILMLFFVILLSTGCGQKKLARINERDSEAQALKKCLRLSEKKHFEEAVECLQIYKSQFPNSTYSQEAELNIGDNYYRKKEYLLAAESYKVFIQTNPASEKLDYAYYRMGLCYEKEMPKAIDRDQTYIKDATDSFHKVVEYFPQSSYAYMAKAKYDQMRNREAKKHFYVGHFYYRTGEFRASIPRFRIIMEEFHDLPIAKDAHYHIAMAYAKLDRMDAARELAASFLEKYPSSRFAKKLSKKLLGDDHG